MKKVLAAVAATALAFAGFAVASHVVTEQHVVVQDPPAMTTVVANGKRVITVVQNPPPMTTTVQDTDTIQHETVTVTGGTTTAPPPPPPPPPTGCSVSVAPGGNLSTAYNSVADGGVICLSAGKYGGWETPTGSKNVTVRGVYPGTKFLRLGVNANNFHLESVEIDGEFTKFLTLHLAGVSGFSFKNGSVGNVTDEKGVLAGGTGTAGQMLNPLFDGVYFHDVLLVEAGVHNECLYNQASGLKIINSTFKNCATMDLFMTRGTWWGQPQYKGLTLENNIFWHSTCGGCGSMPAGWHYYSVQVGNLDEYRDWTIKNNWFENGWLLENKPQVNFVACGNNTGVMPSGFQPLPDAVPASWKSPC